MPTLVASKLIAGGRGLAQVLLRRAATVALDWDTRRKSRFEAVDSGGRTIGVFLPRGTIVRGGDVLVAEDGSLVVVQALAQPVLVATARATSQAPALDLSRAAYHLGNRHVALELRDDRVVLEPDHVLAELLRRLGLEVAETSAAFEPEGGAYDAGSGHAHASRADGRGHEHGHGHGHGHGHDHPHDGDHAHAHGHGHGHDHGHRDDRAHGHGDHGHRPEHP